MKSSIKVIIAAVFLTCFFLATGCGGQQPTGETTSETASETVEKKSSHHCSHCEAKEKEGVVTFWCSGCKAGFIDGKKTKCEGCVQEKLTGSHANYDHVE